MSVVVCPFILLTASSCVGLLFINTIVLKINSRHDCQTKYCIYVALKQGVGIHPINGFLCTTFSPPLCCHWAIVKFIMLSIQKTMPCLNIRVATILASHKSADVWWQCQLMLNNFISCVGNIWKRVLHLWYLCNYTNSNKINCNALKVIYRG